MGLNGITSAAALAAGAMLFTAAVCLARPQQFAIGGEALDKPEPNEDCLTCICHSKSSGWDTSTVQVEHCPSTLKFNCTETFDSGPQCGPYGVSYDYWFDAGHPGIKGFEVDLEGFRACSEDYICATKTVIQWMTRFAEDCDGDGKITCSDYAVLNTMASYGLRCPSRDQQWIYQDHEFSKYAECEAQRDVDAPQRFG